MISQKSHIKPHGGGWFNRESKIFVLFLSLISFSNLIFSNNTFALFTPTLSASVDNAAASVNGNQVINSTSKTTEIPLNLTVNTNNKTGYTATLSSETENTALTNTTSTAGAKINSISTNLSLNNLPNNTWGYKFGTSTNYAPIPALSTPAQILKTAGKTYGNDTNGIKIGLKLGDNLESGRYTNKLIFSILTNNYDPIAIMTEGRDFNTKLKSLETTTNKIEHFKKSTVAPATSMNAVNIEDEDSDYEIKLWLDPTNKTAYYYAEPEKVYLNADSSEMFYYSKYYDEQKIKNILEIDLSNFNTSKVTNMRYMFSGMSNLTTLNLSNFDTSKVTNMYAMFSDMSNLTTLNVSHFDTSKVTNMNAMFNGMSNLATLDLSNFDTSNVTDMGNMFIDMSNLASLNLSSFDTSRVMSMRYMFLHVSNLTTLDLSSFNTSNVTNMDHMFSGMSNLTTLNLSNFNTSRVTDMKYMFSYMSNLTSLNLSNFNTSRVTDMDTMFSNTSNLTSLNLSSFDTSRVTNMQRMFYDMSNLTSLNLSNFDTSKVVYMYGMFYGMSNLTSLNLSNFDTSNVTDMNDMFMNMTNLISLNLSNFDTSKVTTMESMFRNMYNLTSLDLSNFNTSQVTNMQHMFSLYDTDVSKDKLETIYVNNDLNTTKLTNFPEMFGNRKKLRGGNGSYLTNPSTADKTWLRVDRPGVHGYFTRKP